MELFSEEIRVLAAASRPPTSSVAQVEAAQGTPWHARARLVFLFRF